MKTVRELANRFPIINEYFYKWRNTESPELEQDLNVVLSRYNYKLHPEDADIAGEYNDIKGYYDCRIVRI